MNFNKSLSSNVSTCIFKPQYHIPKLQNKKKYETMRDFSWNERSFSRWNIRRYVIRMTVLYNMLTKRLKVKDKEFALNLIISQMLLCTAVYKL